MGSLDSGDEQVAGAGDPPLTLMLSISEPRESTGDGGPSTMPAGTTLRGPPPLMVTVAGGNWKALSADGNLIAEKLVVVASAGCEPPNVGKVGLILSGDGDWTRVAKSCEKEKAVLEDEDAAEDGV